jgi:16S rRNA processing protein RimM
LKGQLQKTNLVKVAKVVGCRALKGELKLYLYSGQAPWQESVKNVYLVRVNSEPVSFKVTKMDSVFLKLTSLNDRTEAEKWVGAEVFITEKELETKSGESIYLREILGFEVSVEDKKIGVVISFETNNSQDLLVVEREDKKTVLIPLIAQFLDKIDYKEKIIYMKLPPGLLEVNS